MNGAILYIKIKYSLRRAQLATEQHNALVALPVVSQFLQTFCLDKDNYGKRKG